MFRAVCGAALTAVLLLSLAPTGAHAATFPDIEGTTHEPAIRAVVAAGVVDGYPDGTFRPDQLVTRGQMAAFLANAFELAEGDARVPPDVAGTTHEAAITAVLSARLASGYPDATFRPQRPVTRGQLASFLVRSFDVPADATVRLRDLPASTHRAAITALTGAGIVAGYPDLTFRPEGTVTRGQLATFLSRGLGLVDRVDPGEDLSQAGPSVLSELPRPSDANPDREPEPVPEPGPEPGVSWASVWGSQDLAAIDAWFAESVGLSDPSLLGGVRTAQVVSTHAGQVIENLDIRYAGGDNKAVWVRHDDVVVRNNRVYAEGDRNVIWVDGGLDGVVIEHNELDGSSQDYGTSRADANGRNVGIATRGPVEAIRYNRILGVRQGAALYPQTVVEYNHVSGLHMNAPGVSTSAFGHLGGGWGFAGGTVIRRNLVEAGTSGAITVYSQAAGPARDVLFAENLVVGVGRGFGIRGGHSGDNRAELRDVRIEGNRFTGVFGFPTVLGQGTNAAVNLDKPGTTFTDNRWLGSSQDLPARCGTDQDDCE